MRKRTHPQDAVSGYITVGGGFDAKPLGKEFQEDTLNGSDAGVGGRVENTHGTLYEMSCY